MTINTAIDQLLEVEQKHGKSGEYKDMTLQWSLKLQLY